MGESKIVAESVNDVRVRSGPGKNRLLVITHSEEIAMSLRQLPNDAVLNRTQILKLVYQHVVPPGAELGCRGGIGPEEALGQYDQIVKVGQIAITQTLLIASQQCRAALAEQPALQAIETEQGQDLGPSLFRHPQSLQHPELVFLVRHSETGAQSALLGKVSQHLEAQSVKRSPSDVLRRVPPRLAEPQGDLFSCLVGKGDSQNPARGDSELLDEMLDPTNQAVGLAGTGPRHDQHRAQRGLDGKALLDSGVETHARTASPPSARAQLTMASASSSMTWS